MRRRIFFVLAVGLCVIACGEELSEGMPRPLVDAGMGVDMRTDSGPLEFFPGADPILPGVDRVFAVARARCQIVVERFNGQTDMVIDRLVWTYDQVGNLTLSEYDAGANGSIERRISRSFMGPDQMIREEDDADGDGVPDTRVLVMYETDGRVVALHDGDGDGMPERRSEVSYQDGRPIAQTWFDIETGLRQSQITYEYDDTGRPVSSERYEGVSESPSDRTTWSYDLRGRLLELGQDIGVDGQIEHRVSYRYDDAERTREGDTLDENGTLRGRVSERFDDQNRLLERIIDIGADGEYEQTSGYAYDGLRLSRFDERSADGTGLSTEYTYTSAGYLERAAQTRLEDPSAVDEVRNFTHYCQENESGSAR